MKKFFVIIALVSLFGQFAKSQENGVAQATSARTALASYKSDPLNNQGRLAEAKSLIDLSLKSPGVQAIASVWLTKGDIYQALLQREINQRQVGANTSLTGDNDALVAFEAYKKCFSLSELQNEKLEAVKGISEVQGHLINLGTSKFEGQEYEASFLSFQAALHGHELLNQNGHTSLLDDSQQLEDHMFYAGMAAVLANRCPDAIVFFNKLYNAGTNKPAVYEGLYNCKRTVGDEAGAGSILQEGRTKFPGDNGLLFAEINHLLKAGDLNKLTGVLEQAIKVEPSNVGLYVTLGNVYDNLYQSATRNKDLPNANAYFDNAKKYYSDALLVDPRHVDATYSIGALYYNKAATLTQEMNALPEDFSTKGREKYNAYKNQVMGLFDQSLPYFKEAERINPNDLNTLIALSEIYARKEDGVISAELKRRLEVVKNGGKNASPYFQ